MKHVKHYFLLLAVICAVVMAVTRPEVHYLVGQASETLQNYYIEARAHSVNKKGFELIYNGVSIETDDMHMSDAMHLMIPLSKAGEYFHKSISVGFDGACCIEGQYIEDGAVVLEEDDGTAVMIDIYKTAAALEIQYEWCDEAYRLVLESDKNQELPIKYDLRDVRSLSQVENQGTSGTCWAFASTAALETVLPLGESMNFSVDHMTMNSGFNILPADGGDYNMALAYLASWKGPVLEADDPYGDGVTDPLLKSVKHLQEARLFKTKDIGWIKSMILRYGSVESSLYMSVENLWDGSEDYNPLKSAYYYSGTENVNHDLIIIGWDDTYSRENFTHMPQSDGAFLCRNSWGTDFGDNGYFYVSYEDVNLGNSGIVYTRLENSDNYQEIYQSDLLGWAGTLGYGTSEAWFSNIYTARKSEMLKAVSFYAVDGRSSYDVYVVPQYLEQSDLTHPVYVGSGYLEYGGYYTFDIPQMEALEMGEKFAVMIHMKTEGSERPVAVEYKASELTSKADVNDGEGYISHDGVNWVSTEDEYQCNICLKAFTG